MLQVVLWVFVAQEKCNLVPVIKIGETPAALALAIMGPASASARRLIPMSIKVQGTEGGEEEAEQKVDDEEAGEDVGTADPGLAPGPSAPFFFCFRARRRRERDPAPCFFCGCLSSICSPIFE